MKRSLSQGFRLACFLLACIVLFSACASSRPASDGESDRTPPSDSTPVDSTPQVTDPTEIEDSTPDEDPTEPAVTVQDVRLFDLDIYSQDNVSYGCLERYNDRVDGDGYHHADCYMLCGNARGSYFVRYELGRKYSTLSGTMYTAENDGNLLWVEFYSGDTLIYITPQMSSEAHNVSFSFSVAGVDYLTVRPRVGPTCGIWYNNWMLTDQFILHADGTVVDEPPAEYIPDDYRLFDLDLYSQDNSISHLSYHGEVTDGDGFVHKNCYSLCCDTKRDYYLRYELDGKYTSLTGTLYTYAENSGTLWVDFYDGNTYLDSSPAVSTSQSGVSFTVDITGVTYLTLYLRNSEDDSNLANNWMIADQFVLHR